MKFVPGRIRRLWDSFAVDANHGAVFNWTDCIVSLFFLQITSLCYRSLILAVGVDGPKRIQSHLVDWQDQLVLGWSSWIHSLIRSWFQFTLILTPIQKRVITVIYSDKDLVSKHFNRARNDKRSQPNDTKCRSFNSRPSQPVLEKDWQKFCLFPKQMWCRELHWCKDSKRLSRNWTAFLWLLRRGVNH
jgi:hypothetical protein